MELKELSIDEREQRLIAAEREIGRLRELQLQDLAELDVAQNAAVDGCRSLSEWVAGRLDVGPETAKTLVRTRRRLLDRPDLQDDLAAGRVSFERVEVVSRIQDVMGLMQWADMAWGREAEKRARITADEEQRAAYDRYLAIQPILDETRWKLWGELDGYSESMVDKVLSEVSDRLADLPDGSKGNQGWRRATALVECLTSDDPPPGQVTVIVDAREAVGTTGEAGVILDSGARMGQRALQAILCDGDTEVTAPNGRGSVHGLRPPDAHGTTGVGTGTTRSSRISLSGRRL